MSKNKAKSFRKEALQATLKKRKECSTKALETVEKLIEKNVTKEILLLNVHHINQSSYQDVVDERSIMNICGYPICCNELRNIPKHQYRITRTNGTLQLYDTTERKKFCSNFCYKAAKFLKDQLPSCPLWLIEPKDTEYFRLMPLDCKIVGSLGEQINFALKSISEMDQYQQKTFISETSDIKTEHLSVKNKDNIENVILSNCDKILCNKNDDDDYDNDDNCDVGEVFKDAITEDLKVNDGVGSDNSFPKQDAIGASAVIVDENEIICDINHVINDNENINKMKSLHVNDGIALKEDSNTISEIAFHNKESTLFDIINNKVTNEVTCSNINEKEYFVNNYINENKVTETNNEKPLSRADADSCKLLTEMQRDESNKIKKAKIKKSKVTSDISPMLAAVLRTEQCIREWVSIDTLFFLLGEEKLRNLIEETCGLDKFQGRQQSSMQDPVVYERYLDICKKLNLLEINESKFDRCVNSEIDNNIRLQKPVPDFEKLKKETREMEIKVKSFYSGDKQVKFSEKNDMDSKGGREVVNIPLVDQHAQRALRRRIILDNLNRVLPDLLRALGLTKHNITITGDVKRLVETFTLSAHNITFRPAEWNFVAIIMIKLLSVRDDILHKTLLVERADKYLTLMLMSYEQDSGYLNRLLTWLLYEHTLFNV